MAEIRVIIVYTDELESISVDGIDMEDISAVRKRPIRDWFSASNGRDGWEGLISEIRKVTDDENADLNFEFQGPQESKHIFEHCIAKLGYINTADGLPRDEVVQRNMEEAKKAEQRGFHKRAFEHYLTAAEYGGVAEAQYRVAEYYYRCSVEGMSEIGIDMTDAMANAVEYYEKAAEQEYAEAQYQLYRLFWDGSEVMQNQQEAVRWLKKAADNKHAKAQCELGNCYEKGEGVEQNWYAAAELYRSSAEQGNAEGQFQIGKRYDLGQGVEQNYELAYEWYKKAAEQGNAKAANNIGNLYKNGDGVKQDYEKAFVWYEKAAEGGSIGGAYNLGSCYANGEGVIENQEKAFEWYKKAAEQGSVEAQNKIGYRYEFGKGTKIDLKQAVEWYRRSAENGNRIAQCNLGYCYKCGRGVEKNLQQAFEWYKKSAEQNYAVGACDLGWCYDFGNGTEKDYEKAIQWYEKAVELGSIRALYLLGQCYEYGTGVKKNIDTAFEWYKKAADSTTPDSDACFKIAEAYYVQVTPESKAKFAGRSTALIATSMLIPVANIISIPVAIVGTGIVHNRKTHKAWNQFLKTDAGKDMMKYYRQAAECGHQKAKERLKFLENI